MPRIKTIVTSILVTGIMIAILSRVPKVASFVFNDGKFPG